MGLVDYDSEDSDSEGNQGVEPARKLPQLPERLLDLYQTGPKVSEDPAFHEGRTRTHEHVSGLWPTHVYLQWLPNDQEMSRLKHVIKNYDEDVNGVESLVETSLGVRKPLHVSLSDTLMIPTDQKAAYLELLKQIQCPPILAHSSDVRILTNQTKTRAFLALMIHDRDHKVTRLIDQVNNCAKNLDLPLLHTDTPHISIGWIDLQKNAVPEGRFQTPRAFDIEFDEIKVKIGRDVHNIALQPQW